MGLIIVLLIALLLACLSLRHAIKNYNVDASDFASAFGLFILTTLLGSILFFTLWGFTSPAGINYDKTKDIIVEEVSEVYGEESDNVDITSTEGHRYKVYLKEATLNIDPSLEEETATLRYSQIDNKVYNWFFFGEDTDVSSHQVVLNIKEKPVRGEWE